MFIQTESTPNPAALKFLPGRPVLESGVADFTSRDAASRSPLARLLFEIDGVDGVFLASDFITVTKAGDKDWQVLKPMVLGAIMDHFTSGAPVMERRRRRGRGRRGRPGQRSRFPDQGIDRDSGAPCRCPGRRRHHLQGLQERHGVSALARLMRGLPQLHRHPEDGHREYAQALCARSASGRSGRLKSPCLNHAALILPSPEENGRSSTMPDVAPSTIAVSI